MRWVGACTSALLPFQGDQEVECYVALISLLVVDDTAEHSGLEVDSSDCRSFESFLQALEAM